jgi:flagellar hook-basal body complex protein FliE
MALIDRLPPLPVFPNTQPDLQPKVTTPQSGGFGETFKSFISDVNQMQVTEAQKEQQFATGQIKDVHEVMAASEEAGLSLMLLIEVRNKLLDGYKELSRIPV